MQLLSRFVFNGVRVRLEPLNVIAQTGVFLLQILNLLPQLFVLGTLLLPGRQAMLAIHDAPSE